MKYKVGDNVILSSIGVERYGDAPSNPRNTLGIIVDTYDDEEFIYHVRWSNGTYNDYKEHEIEIEIEPEFTVGEEYTDKNDMIWKCIHIREDGNAILDNGTDVIVNYPDGSNVDGWDHLDLSFTKSATCGGTYCMPVTGECHKYRIHFDIVNGKPGWQSAKVTGV